jgi:ATP/maltotriose-dependent transcriptional regulator MalT
MHAEYYLRLAEEAEPHLLGAEQERWFTQLEREHDNLRAAHAWTLERGKSGESPEMALRLAGALERFWEVRGYVSEGGKWLEQALLSSEGSTLSTRAKALRGAGWLALMQGSIDRAEILCQQALQQSREARDTRGMAWSLHRLGLVAYRKNDDNLARSRLEESLTLFRQLSDQVGLAYVLLALGGGAIDQGEHVRASSLVEEGLALFRECGDKMGTAWSMAHLGRVFFAQGEAADALLEKSLALFRELGDKRGIAFSLLYLAQVRFAAQTDQTTVSSLLEESLALFRAVGHKWGFALCFLLAGQAALSRGDVGMARASLKESLRLCREIDHMAGMVESLSLLARVAILQGDDKEAYTLFEECLSHARQVSHKGLLASCLEGMASLLVMQSAGKAGVPLLPTGRSHEAGDEGILWAVRLWGAAEVLREAAGITLSPFERADYERAVAAARTRLGDLGFAAAWIEGRAMTPEQAIAAREQLFIPDRTHKNARANRLKNPVALYPNDLTEREAEVLRLVARGLTDAQVAQILVVSPRTVNAHLRSIYSKLNITSRHAATLFALQHQLI